MTRRWAVDDWLELGGVRFSVCAGKKGPTDLVLKWETPRGSRAVPMSVGFLLADFFTENEDLMRDWPKYQHLRSFEGGAMYIRFLKHAARHGWTRAQAGLDAYRGVPSNGQVSFIETEEVAYP